MRLAQFTERKSPATGKPYPRCQHVSNREQCNRTAYSDRLCWKHYRQDAPAVGEFELDYVAGLHKRIADLEAGKSRKSK